MTARAPGSRHYSSFCEKLKVPAVTNSRPVMTMDCLTVLPAHLLSSAACVTASPLSSEGPELLDLWADQNADDFNLEASAGQSQQSRTLKIGLKVNKNILKALKLM